MTDRLLKISHSLKFIKIIINEKNVITLYYKLNQSKCFRLLFFSVATITNNYNIVTMVAKSIKIELFPSLKCNASYSAALGLKTQKRGMTIIPYRVK